MKFCDYDLKKLKEQFWTPLYIFNAEVLKQNIRDFKEYFKSSSFDTDVIYASKAFNVKEMLRIVKDEWICLDCVSIWEIYTALKVDFPMERVYFHGNNKSEEDLNFALDNKIWTIVVDNLWELVALEKLSQSRQQKVNILIRLNTEIYAHTHKFIATADTDSKFWILFDSEECKEMLEIVNRAEYINFLGFHSHIWSQIFDLTAFKVAIEKLISYCKNFEQPLVLDLWWWFAVHYTDEDKPIPFIEVSKILIKYAEEISQSNGVKIKKLCIEPWRSIVGEAWATLYTIWYKKKTPNKQYYFIDWWMTDNIRPALYQAKYDADIVWKENQPKNKIVTIAWNGCESWDLLIEDYPMQEADTWDLVIMYTTWAYGYAMSSNYNKMLTPAVVFVEKDKAKLVVKRQTYDEMIEREI